MEFNDSCVISSVIVYQCLQNKKHFLKTKFIKKQLIIYTYVSVIRLYYVQVQKLCEGVLASKKWMQARCLARKNEVYWKTSSQLSHWKWIFLINYFQQRWTLHHVSSNIVPNCSTRVYYSSTNRPKYCENKIFWPKKKKKYIAPTYILCNLSDSMYEW